MQNRKSFICYYCGKAPNHYAAEYRTRIRNEGLTYTRVNKFQPQVEINLESHRTTNRWQVQVAGRLSGGEGSRSIEEFVIRNQTENHA